MKLIHPNSSSILSKRNTLLQKTLRPHTTKYSIESEYPIVLSPNFTQYSCCIQDGETIYAHANLWPRTVQDRSGVETFQVGLIGNVATAESYRGMGLMRRLFEELTQVAKNHNLAALILWSDLNEFYHKLGFDSLGKEYHFSFESMNLETLSKSTIQETPKSNINIPLLTQMMELRYPVLLTLNRSMQEYQTLTQIPDMDLFTAWQEQTLVGFAWIGKGEDMIGVIHEWGAQEPEILIDLIYFISRYKNLERIMLLSPYDLNETWHQTLLEESFICETISMSFIKIMDEDKREILQDLFVWGLDSI
jgi:hypothetical protein